MTNVWRLRMKSGKPDVIPTQARAFAFDRGWVGAGWGLDGSPYNDALIDGSTDIAAYEDLASKVFQGDGSFRRALTAIGSQMVEGDYCWAYDSYMGEYWCARVEGGFRYRQGGQFDDYDLHMLRPCTWAKAGTADAVPGAIRRAFAGPFGTVTTLKADKDRLIGAAKIILGEPGQLKANDLFEAAGPEDLEDLVALYLQAEGWRIYPSTAKVTMASYEFVVVHEESGARAGVQVKSGGINRLRQGVAGGFDHFFVFLAGGNPQVDGDERLSVITRAQIMEFAHRNLELLPLRLMRSWTPTTAQLAI